MSLVGETIRSIRLSEQLGEGGMGEVYLGVDTVLGRKVAVKVIRASMRPNRQAKARFVREARLLSQLEHPHICRIYEFVEGDDADFIVLEMVPGRTLTAELDGGLSYEAKLRIAIQIADALRAAHAISVVHRDLKPDNIMVDPDGLVKVLDFGLAREISTEDDDTGVEGSQRFEAEARESLPDETSVTEIGSVVGTPKYMSPEQARGEKATAATDVYAFGLVLQEMFSSTPPYPPDLDSKALIAKALWGDSQPVTGVGTELRRLVEEMKSLSQADRPTMSAVASRLRSIADAPRRRRRRVAAAAVGTLLVLAAVTSTFGFLQARRSQQEAERARAEAEAVNAFLTEMLESAAPTARGVDVRVVDVLDDAANSLAFEFEGRPADRAAVHHTLGATYAAIGSYQAAEEQITAAIELRSAELGPTHRATLASKKDLGRLRLLQGDEAESESMLRELLETCDRLLDPDDELTLAAAMELGLTLAKRGSYDEAERLMLRALDGRRRTVGAEDAETLAIQDGLGVLMRRQARYDEAEALHRQTLEIKERVFGPNHPLTVNTLNNLASLRFVNREYKAAEELYRRVVELRRVRYGDDHPAVFTALGNVAICLSRQGRYEEAEAVGTAQVEGRRRILGPDHPETLTAENNLANTYRRWGKSNMAEDMYRSTLERQQRVLGEEHPDTVRTMSNLAKVAQDLGRYDEAVELNRRVVEIRRRTLGDDHPHTLSNLYNLGAVLCQIEEFEEAEVILREVLEASARTRGEGDVLTAMAANGVSLAVASQGRLTEAIEFQSRWIDVCRRSLGDDHRETRTGRRHLAELLRAVDRIDEAEKVEAELAASTPS